MKIKLVGLCAVFMTALVLFGCGGGGGGGGALSSTTPTPTPSAPLAPTATLASVTPASGATDVATNVSPVFNLSVTDAASSDASQLSLLCNSKTVAFTSASALSTDGKTMTVTLTPTTGAIVLSDLCTISGDITTTGPGGTVITTVGISFSVVAPTCTAPAIWTPGINTCVSPMGVKVVGTNQLPVGCDSSSFQCFKDAVESGAVKAVASGGTDNTGPPIVFLYFKNTTATAKTTGLWNVLPFHMADGSYSWVDIPGGFTDEIDAVWGSPKGAIFHTKITGLCYEWAYDTKMKWVIDGAKGINTPTACPK